MSRERYINLSDRQVKDTQNQSQDFMSINAICRRLNQQDAKIADLEAKLAESEKESEEYVMSAIERYVDLTNRLAEKEKERELDNSFWKQECDSLQKTLAEKEKEIEILNKMVDILVEEIAISNGYSSKYYPKAFNDKTKEYKELARSMALKKMNSN